MKKYILIYSAGVVTAPVWYWVFRKPLSKALVPILADEELDTQLFTFMSARLEIQERRKKEQKS